jgi:hypothetical protein
MKKIIFSFFSVWRSYETTEAGGQGNEKDRQREEMRFYVRKREA